MIKLPEKHRILIVDDEPDIASVTRLSLKGLKYGKRSVEFAVASTGKEAVEMMRERPDTAVILLDVVMETSSAGLDACRAVREDLGNKFVRILLRTGQPGVAPEKKTIDEYDIDGYLPKAELTTNRLYTAARTALKAFEELIELERHRQIFSFLHDSVIALRSFEPLESTLQRILTAAASIAPTPLAVLDLHTFEEHGNPRRCMLHISAEKTGAEAANAVAAGIAANPEARVLRFAGPFEKGYLIPLNLHRDLGYGWLYLEGEERDELALKGLSLLAAHASNALYSAVAQEMLAAREGPFYDTLIV